MVSSTLLLPDLADVSRALQDEVDQCPILGSASDAGSASFPDVDASRLGLPRALLTR